jgi:type II secretory pathway component GspD/PulD (secretin)
MRAVSSEPGAGSLRRRLRSVLRGLLLLLSIGALAATAAEPELRVFTLKYRLAGEVIPVIRPLLARGESVSGVDAKLIVRAGAATTAQIEQLLAEIDVPRRNLRISVRHTGQTRTVQQSGGAAGEIRSGDTRIVIRNGTGTGTSGGISVGRSTPGGGAQIHSERRVTTTRDASTQTVTVLDGGRAFLHVGESIPVVQPYLVLVGPRLAVATGVTFYDVTTGFDVEPRIQGDRVLLAVHPRLSFRSNHGVQVVDYQELRTQVTVTPGEWVDLGGIVKSANEVNRQILSDTHRTQTGDSRFLIRVDPL